MTFTKNIVGVAVEERGSKVVVTVNDETTAADVLRKVNSKIATNPAFQANRAQRLVVEHLLVNGDTYDADINIREACEDGDKFVAVPAFVPPLAPPAAAAAGPPLTRGRKRPHSVDGADEGGDDSHEGPEHKAKQLKGAPAAAAAAAAAAVEGNGSVDIKMETDEEETEVSFTYATLDRTSTVSVSNRATVDELKQQILEEELALRDIPAAAAARPTRKNKKPVDIVRSNVGEFGACGDCDSDCRCAAGAKMAYRFDEADLVNRSDVVGTGDRCGFCRQLLEAVCLQCSQGGRAGAAGGMAAQCADLTLVTLGSGEAPKKLPKADSCPIVKNTSCNHKYHWHCLCSHFDARMKTTGLRTCPSCQVYWRFSLPQPQAATAAVGANSFDLEVLMPSSTVCGVGGGQADWQRVVIRLNSNTTRKQLPEALARAVGFNDAQWGLRVLRVGQLTIPLGSIALHESLEFVGIKLRATAQITTYQRGGSDTPLPCITATLCTVRHHPLSVKLKLQLPVGYTVKQGTQTSRHMELVAGSDHKLKTLSHKIQKASGLLSDRVRLSLREDGDNCEMRLRDPSLSVVDIIALALSRSGTDDSNTPIHLSVTEAPLGDARFVVDILSAYHRMPSYSGKWTVQQLIDHLKYVPALSPDVTAYVNVRPTMALATTTDTTKKKNKDTAMDTDSDGEVIDVDSEDQEDGDEDEGGQEGNGGLDAVFAAASEWGLPMNAKNNVKMQTPKGVSDLLASLYVLAEKADASSINKLTGHLRAVVSFPPAVYAMRVILSAKTGTAKQIGSADKALVARVMWKLLREMAPSTIPDEQLFEHSRVLLHVLPSRGLSQDGDTEAYRKVPLTCATSHARLTRPVYSENVQESNLTVRDRLMKLYSGLRDESMSSSSSSSVPSPSKHMALLLQATPPSCMEVLVWLPPEDEAMEEGEMDTALRSLAYQWDMVKKDAARPREVTCLQLVSPAALGQAQAPALTIDEDLRTAVYRGMEPCGSGRVMYRPLRGCELVFDLQQLADKVSSHVGEMGEGELVERHINEAIIVVLDCSSSMSKRTTFVKDQYDSRPRPFREDAFMRRLRVVAQLFSTLVNRIEAYDTPNCLGLILFSDPTNIRYTCQLSPYLERFRRAVDDARWSSGTAIFDAVKRAREELVKWKAAKPSRKKAQLRIIVLSDGEDNRSFTTWFSESKALRQSNVLCDAVIVGGTDNDQLKYLAKATGGYVFKPDSIRNALKLCELEVMLSASERPPNLRPDTLPNSEFVCSRLLANSTRFPIDVCDDTTVPPRRQVAQLLANQTFRSLAAALQANNQADEDGEGGQGQGQGEGSQWVRGRRQSARIASHGHAAQEGGGQRAARVSGGGGGEGGGGNQERSRRLMREMRGLLQHPHPAIDVYPSQTDIGFWRIVMEGPDGTVYKGGTWLLYMIFPADYPNRPPELRFETPIQHANVNAYGKVCHPILGRAYTTDSTVRSILENVYGLLLNPDYVDPVDSTLAMAFYQGQGDYEARIVQHVRQHARRTRQQWKNTLTAEGGETSGAGAAAAAAAGGVPSACGGDPSACGGDPSAGRRTRHHR
ncbi:unnamed protein product [Vitrella brassicaformis CCMP3155]|uniref:UBC core domain-containing protein n=1 Tax=Vitrella brassicaformis (strain CCMP3155) TaxID=1169540 RepID=A0A0G4EDD1_VITBC|nr:unnamed protein product [Vitrella brassicaformis CCMP3155]|eukprot:CEL93368.1 unnamed protein product [Vitrella brassicaformis CCMP3155]